MSHPRPIDLCLLPEARLALALRDHLALKGFPGHVDPRGRTTAVVLEDAEQYEAARAEVEHFLAEPDHPRYWQASWQTGDDAVRLRYAAQPGGLRAWWYRGGPVTKGVTLLCLAVFLLLWVKGQPVYEALRFPAALTPEAFQHQWWRLLTPTVLHFSVMHIAFNLLWWWELGSLIERSQSSLQLALVTVTIALFADLGQFLAYGPGFGGLSGVVYGLLGYIWLYPRFNPAIGFQLRKEVVWIMLGFLALGWSGLIDPLVGGKVSNIGHTIGLGVGIVLGVLFGLLHRRPAA